MQVIVMAGGVGSRLGRLTDDRPKPCLPIANRPLLEHILSQLAGQGFRDVTLTLHHRPEIVHALLGDGRRLGLRLSYSIEPEALGTAGGVKRAVRGRYPVVVMSGDVVTDVDVNELVAAHQHSGAAATMAVASVADPRGFGVVSFDRHHRITSFHEKPDLAPPGASWINCGVYVLDPAVLHGGADAGVSDLSRDVFPRMLRGGQFLHAWPLRAYWCDAGTPDRYLRANLDVLSGAVRWTVAGVRQNRGIWAEPEVVIGPRCRLRQAALGQGASVAEGARMQRVVVGRDATVGEGADLAECVLLEGAEVRAHARLRRVIVMSGGVEYVDAAAPARGTRAAPGPVLPGLPRPLP